MDEWLLADTSPSSRVGDADRTFQSEQFGANYTDMISTIDPSGGAIVSTTAVGKSPRYVVASPDGRAIYVSNGEDGTVSVLEASASP